MRGGIGGTRAACASKSTTASWRARSGGRAGRHTSGGRETDQVSAVAAMTCSETVYPMQTIRGRVVRERGRVGCAAALGVSEHSTKAHVQGNLAGTDRAPRRNQEDALRMSCETSYSGYLKLNGEEHERDPHSGQQLRVVPCPTRARCRRRSQDAAAQNNPRGATRSR